MYFTRKAYIIFTDMINGFTSKGRTWWSPASDVRIFSLMTLAFTYFIFSDELAVAVSADCQDHLFYWTDVTGGKISRASLEGYDKEVVARGT